MTLDEIQAINRATDEYVAARRAGKIPTDTRLRAYYGYINVDVYDCPPFLMFTNNDVPAAHVILTEGTYEPCSISVWCALARQASAIVDVGANAGVYSLCAAKVRPDLPIHAFEPNPYAYARLRLHKHINQLDNLVEHPVALGAKKAHIKLAWVAKSGGHISSGGTITEYDGPDVESVVAPLTTLEAIGIANTLGPRPLFKIDVEGTELQVIRGLGALFDAGIDIIVETFKPEVCDEVGPRLAALGYHFYGIRESNLTLEVRTKMEAASKDGCDFNQLLTRRTPSELISLLPPDIGVGLPP